MLTAHDTPQMNGAAERLNGTIGGHMRAMLISSGLPESFWGHAALYAVWLRNRTPTKKTAPQTPLEVLTGEKPDLSRARPFGCRVWVRVDDVTKLQLRAEEATVTVERNVRFEDGTSFGEDAPVGGVVNVPSAPVHQCGPRARARAQRSRLHGLRHRARRRSVERRRAGRCREQPTST